MENRESSPCREFEIEPYRPEAGAEWDAFVRASRNGTFLFERAYMDYHRDRFEDISLIVRDQCGAVAALFAACRGADAAEVSAHRGLTYGGLIIGDKTGGAQVLEMISAICGHYRREGFNHMVIKPVPHTYHRFPAEEIEYALWRAGARWTGSQLSAAIKTGNNPGLTTNTLRNIQRSGRYGYDLRPSDAWAEFHAMLTENLSARHSATPVHTLAELQTLAAAFPANIRLVCAFAPDGSMQAGVVLYITDACTHCQYIASTPRGRQERALTALLYHLTQTNDKEWFDFGVSCEDGGRILNEGLLRQKNGFGARGIAYNVYEIDF